MNVYGAPLLLKTMQSGVVYAEIASIAECFVTIQTNAAIAETYCLKNSDSLKNGVLYDLNNSML